MKRRVICIYGETCAGKSTLGKRLARTLRTNYVSFGDQKRIEIAHRSSVGIAIERFLEAGLAISPEVGFSLIESQIIGNPSILSGYPISAEEFVVLSSGCSLLGIISLTVDSTTILNRFQKRRVCPRCGEPGVEGDACSIHGALKKSREDASLDELARRRKLYHQRIGPFLYSGSLLGVPRLDCDTGVLDLDQVAQLAEHWVAALLRGEDVAA